VPVWSARATSKIKVLALRAEALLPKRFRVVTLAAAVIVLTAGAWFGGDWTSRSSAPVQVTVPRLSIAVLPFTSSKNPELDYLAEGIPEEIRASLSAIPGMQVIGRDSSSYYIDHTASAEEIGRTLGVAWLLRGDFRSVDDEIHASVKLLNTANSEAVWEEQFAAFRANYASFGPDIVQRITIFLGITDSNPAGLPLLAPLTVNPEAYALYLEAKSYIWRGYLDGAIKAISLLQAAVELDPAFAEAHAILSKLFLFHAWLDEREEYNPAIRKKLAMQSLEKAILLKPDSPLVLAAASMARLVSKDFDGALAMAERALRIDPNNVEALRARSYVQMKQSDLAGALQTKERVMKLEPLSVESMAEAWAMLTMAGRHQEALEIANRILALYPDDEVAGVHAWASDSKLKLGDRLGALQSYSKGLPDGLPVDLWTGIEHDQSTLDNFYDWQSHFAHTYLGDYEQARQVMMNRYDEPESRETWLQSKTYLVSRGELESIAGNYESSLKYFGRAGLLASAKNSDLFSRGSGTFSSKYRQSHANLALLLAFRKIGQHEQANLVSIQIRALIAERRGVLATINDQAKYAHIYQEAQYNAIEGHTSEALSALRNWVEHGVIFTYLGWDPVLENLRGDPGFEAIVAGVEADLAEVRARYVAQQAMLAEGQGG
jgi:TolB-like protein/Tfp pilus assembly protein PilF